MDSKNFKHLSPIQVGFIGAILAIVVAILVGYFTPINHSPVAKIEADKTEGTIPLSISFSAENSYDIDKEDELIYHWDFGESYTSNSINTRYTYLKAGNYIVKLIVIDKKGISDTTSLEIKAFAQTDSL